MQACFNVLKRLFRKWTSTYQNRISYTEKKRVNYAWIFIEPNHSVTTGRPIPDSWVSGPIHKEKREFLIQEKTKEIESQNKT